MARREEIPAITAPPFRLFNSPPAAPSEHIICSSPITPKSPFPMHSTMVTQFASPVMKTFTLEEPENFTVKLDPHDNWLPITESRNGNAYYAAFHTLSSGIGVQALLLPLAFTTLGWIWGTVCLIGFFVWQLYTLWLLIHLHESEDGTRYSRYLRLSMVAFGEKRGRMLAQFPIMYLSGGTCVALTMIGGGTMKLLFEMVCDQQRGYKCGSITPPSITEWYLIFLCCAIILAQLPNLNSMAKVSLVGAVTAISYCTMIWALSISKNRPAGVSYEPAKVKTAECPLGRVCGVLNAVGIIAFAFRGHNVVLEIQGTMPSSRQKPSYKPMWKGVKFAYLVIAMCLFPVAIGGYWAYGNSIPTSTNQGMLSALYKYHQRDTSKTLLGLISLLVVINSISSFQIYAMPVFDNFESRYAYKKHKPCPQWLRTSLRIFFGCLVFFISVALPFLPSLAGLIGGIALPITLAYPCLMWFLIKKPPKYGVMWCITGLLGMLGLVLSTLVVGGAIWNIVTVGIDLDFFKPK